MRDKRRIKTVWHDGIGQDVYLLQRHVNYIWLEWLGCKGWWTTDAQTIFRDTAKSWAWHYDIKD